MDNVIWDAWSTVWTGNDVNETYVDEWVINTELNRREKRRTTTTTSTRTGSRTRQGYYDHIREIITDTNQGNVVLAKEIIPYIDKIKIKKLWSKKIINMLIKTVKAAQ